VHKTSGTILFLELIFLNRTVTLTAWNGMQINPLNLLQDLGEKLQDCSNGDKLHFFKGKKN